MRFLKQSIAAMTRRGVIAVAFALSVPGIARAQFATTVRSNCVGGAIGCSELDFFVDFVGLTAPLALDAFSLTMHDPAFLFQPAGTTEAEDALGLNFYNPIVSPDGHVLAGTFDFGAFLDPDITSTLRIRADMRAIPAGTTDTHAMPFDYQVAAGGDVVASGSVAVIPPVVATPEPVTILLLATGLAGVGGWTRRRAWSRRWLRHAPTRGG